MNKNHSLTGYPAVLVANRFLHLSKQAGEPLFSLPKLMKLAYISHGFYLALHDRPLMAGKIVARQYGPVPIDIYNKFRQQLSRPNPLLPLNKEVAGLELDEDAKKVTEEVWKHYGDLSRDELTDRTHMYGFSMGHNCGN